jgi:mannitol 2-dehydrogenase
MAQFVDNSTVDMAELCNENLQYLEQNGSLQVPHYSRNDVENWICHIGVGGFHRSHQAYYLHQLLENQWQSGDDSTSKWGICGIGLMEWDRKMYECLKSQDYMYTLVTRDQEGAKATVVGSIMDYVFAPEDRSAPVHRLSCPSTHIVSLTITEKGYCMDSSGNLNLDNEMIKHDLSDLDGPQTAIGLLTAAIKARRDGGLAPFTVLSCDNLPMNGSRLRTIILQFADQVDHELKVYIEENVSFPNTMVDRITPALKAGDVDAVEASYGVKDKWPVIAENFIQWVIEDNFALERPEFEQVGALVVDDVHPYEWMKLRLLNGTHSALANLSYLCGHRDVDVAMADDQICAFVEQYMEQVTPTIPAVPGVDLTEYKAALVSRFSNPHIKDQVQRLAEDGSQKLLTTMRDPMLELAKDGLPLAMIALAVAAFMRYMTGEDEQGDAIKIKDPKTAALKEPCVALFKSHSMEKVCSLVSMILGEEAAQTEVVQNEVLSAVKMIGTDGTRTCLSTWLGIASS